MLSLACPSKGNVVIVAGDFIFGGRRVVPGWAASTQNIVLNNLAIFRLDDTGTDIDASNLCPVGRLDLTSSLGDEEQQQEEEGTRPRLRRTGEVDTGKKLQKVSCTPDGRPGPEGEVGVVMLPTGNNDVNGPPIAEPRPFVSAVLCLTDACTDVVVGGRFNSVLGVEAHSVALLRFDDGFYSAVASVYRANPSCIAPLMAYLTPLSPPCPSCFRPVSPLRQSLQQVPGSSSGVLAWPPQQPTAAGEGVLAAAASCVAPIPGVDGSVFSLAGEGKRSHVCPSPEFHLGDERGTWWLTLFFPCAGWQWWGSG